MITHDELIFCLSQKYPNLVHGIDFWIGQNMCRDTGKQLEPARIIAWHVDEQPTDDEVAALIEQHGDAAHRHVLEQRAREERDRRLLAADTMLAKALDSGDTAKMQEVARYRQALREVPEQAGFPTDIKWPSVDDALAERLPSDG